jgi:cell division protein FtsQ
MAPARRDPAPSRAAYRLHRLWLTPLFRALLRVGLPAFLLALTVGLYLSDADRRAQLGTRVADLTQKLQDRPEFMVRLVAVDGASEALASAVRNILPLELPTSSFALDLAAMRATIEQIDAVKSAALRVRPGGILQIDITERQPAAIWRTEDGLFLLDDTGHRIAGLTNREARPELPLVAGLGAEAAVPEALALIAAAGPIAPRIRGLVRIGERRWDLVLDRGQRILLPAAEPVAALDRVIALDQAEDILARDLSAVDLRNARRPTLRLSEAAVARIRGEAAETKASVTKARAGRPADAGAPAPQIDD